MVFHRQQSVLAIRAERGRQSGPDEPILARSIQQDLRRHPQGLSEIFAAFACMIRLDATSGYFPRRFSRTPNYLRRRRRADGLATTLRLAADERVLSRSSEYHRVLARVTTTHTWMANFRKLATHRYNLNVILH